MIAAANPIATRDAPEPGNVVVAFPRRHLGASPATSLTIEADARPAPSAAQRRAVLGPAIFLVCSLGVHAGLYVLLARPPKPLASVATIAMSLEIVLGADLTAGVDKRPTEAEAMTTASVANEPGGEPEPVAKPETSEPRPVEQAIAQPASVAQPDQSVATPQAQAQDDPPPLRPSAEVAAHPEAEPVMTEAQPSSEVAAHPEVEPTPRMTEPPHPDVAVNRPARVQRAPMQPARKQPRVSNDTAQRRRPGKEMRMASAASTGSSGIGRGRSDAESNYPGLVAAHLARYKQFPADAQARGDRGSTVVSFGIDGNGRVTGVRLTRASGVASIDQESQAMVRRASPVPPPPTGHAMTLTVPLSFDLRR